MPVGFIVMMRAANQRRRCAAHVYRDDVARDVLGRGRIAGGVWASGAPRRSVGGSQRTRCALISSTDSGDRRGGDPGETRVDRDLGRACLDNPARCGDDADQDGAIG